ncbi:hypothetical protein [Streptomyces sasae]|uniref:hypothetical protein n=1 Tax=Streptomyces sasae TaxID=1266772 RepID=UPI00292DC93D|nr:hypothetical protein [Streptomyces sasae]
MRFVATVTPVHEDGTECTHTGPDKTSSECTGRTGYRASCTGGTCAWTKTGKRSSTLAEDGTTHLASHLTASAGRR